MNSYKQALRNGLNEKQGVKVKGHRGTWYSIEKKETFDGHTLYLMEHETYGDEAASVIIDEEGTLLLEGVYNGFDDYVEALEHHKFKPFYKAGDPNATFEAFNPAKDFVRKVMVNGEED